MKPTIFWINNNLSGKTIYYFHLEKVKNVLYLLNQWDLIDKVSVYRLTTEFTEEIIENLLNDSFTHCMLPNYDKAISIDPISLLKGYVK